MNLDEGMRYDKPRRAKTVPWIPVVAVAVAAVIVLGVAVVMLASSGKNEATPAPPPPAASAPADAGAGDHGPVATTADTAAWSTLTYFLDGWASKDSTVRKRVFAKTAVAGLAQGLADTSPYKTIVQPVEQIEVVGAGFSSVEFRIHFLDVETPTRVILVADPDAESGWLVQTIEKIGA